MDNDTRRPDQNAATQTSAPIEADSTDIPVLSLAGIKLDADKRLGRSGEFVRCTGMVHEPWPMLTGCSRGLRPEDRGHKARRWPAGTYVYEVPWTTTEVRTDFPSNPTDAMIGRDFAWDAQDGNVYRYHVVESEGSPLVIWDDEPPAVTDSPLMFAWQSHWVSLSGVSGIAIDASGNLYVGASTLVRKYSPTLLQWSRTVVSDHRHMATDGTTLFISGRDQNLIFKWIAATNANGTPPNFGGSGTANGLFSGPIGIVTDGANVWVVDSGNDRIQNFTAAGVYVSSFQFGASVNPTGLALNAGTLYVLCAGTGDIRKFNAATLAFIETFSPGSGTAEGKISATAEGIAVDALGRIWVADTGNHRINVYDSAGVFIASYGSFGSGAGQFKSPYQIAYNAFDGKMYIADSGNSRIVSLTPTAVTPFTSQVVAPAAGQVLFWDATLQTWVNHTLGITLAPTGRNNSTSLNAGVSGTVNANCSAGEVATGGGCDIPTVNVVLTQSRPNPVSGTPTGWSCGATNNAAAARTLTAYAVCMPAPTTG